MKGEVLVVTFAVKKETNLYKAVSNVFINLAYMDSWNLLQVFFLLFLKNVLMYRSYWLNFYLTSKYGYGIFYAIPYRCPRN